LMLATKVSLIVLNAASSILVARFLAPSGRGLVAVALSAVVLLVQFGNLGLDTTNTFFASTEAAARRRLVANSLSLAIATGLLLVAVGLGLRLVAPSVVKGLSWTWLAIALA